MFFSLVGSGDHHGLHPSAWGTQVICNEGVSLVPGKHPTLIRQWTTTFSSGHLTNIVLYVQASALLALPVFVIYRLVVETFWLCWGLVLKCFKLGTRQHRMSDVKTFRPLKHYFLKDLMNFGRRL
jgi:hypothetical protein